ncbi:MAG: hypothetical protein WC071_06330 [Victivallaceae bacterium]
MRELGEQDNRSEKNTDFLKKSNFLKLNYYMRSSVMFIIVLTLCLSSQFVSVAAVDFKQEWQLQDAFQEHSATRDKICLNGRWQIHLLTADELKKTLTVHTEFNASTQKLSVKQQMLENMKKLNKKNADATPIYPSELAVLKNDQSLYLCVPGLFYNSDGRQTGLQGQGLGNANRAGWGATRQLTWNGKNIKEYPGAVYQREISISNPSENYFIQLDNVKNLAVIYINGQFAGTTDGREGAQISITKFLRVGVNALQIVVKPESPQAQLRGIPGDVWLLRRSTKQFIRQAILETSDFTKKQLTLKINFDGRPQGQVEVTFQDGHGECITLPAGSLTPAKTPTGRIDYFYTATFNFPGVKPWTTQHPNLYKCKVVWKKDGKIVDETTPFNFGFRELKTEGRNYVFNGNRFHFRNALAITYQSHLEYENYKRFFAELKKAGINSVSLWSPDVPDNLFALADEQGVMLNVFLCDMLKDNIKNWNDSSVRGKVRKQLTDYLKSVQNHPSVVHYFIEPSILAYPQDISPYGIANDTLKPEKDYDNNKAQSGPAAEFADWVKAFDSHKKVLQYAGGAYGGDVYSTMIYLNFVQLQDKKSWLDGWTKTGTKPFYAIEMGMPWDSSYYHDHISGTTAPRASEPMLAEYCAIDFGDAAYPQDNKEWYRKQFACKVKPHAQNGNDFYVNGSSLFYAYWRPGRPLNLQQQERLLFTETVRAWRYRGANMTPWAYAEMIADNDGRLEEAVTVDYKNYKTPGLKPLYKLNSIFKRHNDNYKALTESMADRLIFIAD